MSEIERTIEKETLEGLRILGLHKGRSCDKPLMSVHGTTLAAHTDHGRYHMWGTNVILKNGKQPELWRRWENSFRG